MTALAFMGPATQAAFLMTPFGLPVYYQKKIVRADLERNENSMFIFGDNTIRQGMGGQAAEMRFAPNAFGIATLWAPGVYFHESQYASATKAIMQDIEWVSDNLHDFSMIVFPADGIGTGFAHLLDNAPSIKSFLDVALEQRFGIINA